MQNARQACVTLCTSGEVSCALATSATAQRAQSDRATIIAHTSRPVRCRSRRTANAAPRLTVIQKAADRRRPIFDRRVPLSQKKIQPTFLIFG